METGSVFLDVEATAFAPIGDIGFYVELATDATDAIPHGHGARIA